MSSKSSCGLFFKRGLQQRCIGESEIMPCRYLPGMFLAVPALTVICQSGNSFRVKHMRERAKSGTLEAGDASRAGRSLPSDEKAVAKGHRIRLSVNHAAEIAQRAR